MLARYRKLIGMSALSILGLSKPAPPDLRGLLHGARMSSKRLVEARVVAIEGHRARELEQGFRWAHPA
jgi:hypothetical protein